MRRGRLLGAAAAAALALASGPITASACVISNCGFNPATHNTWSQFNCTVQSSTKLVSSLEVAFPYDTYITHSTDSWAPPNGTQVGSVSVTANWTFLFCTSSTQTFKAVWVSPPDGGYTPPTGWTVTAEMNLVNSLATLHTYAIENASGDYKWVWPSWPNLTCSGHTISFGISLGSSTTQIIRTPTTAGTYTITVTLNYTDSTNESCSVTFTIT